MSSAGRGDDYVYTLPITNARVAGVEVLNQTAALPASLPYQPNRSQYFKDLSRPFCGFNRPEVKISQGLSDSFWLQGMTAGLKPAFDCIKAFSETDFTEDFKRFDVPTLILHGDAIKLSRSALRRFYRRRL